MTKRSLRIDAHQHFWDYSRAEYGWIDVSMARIARDFGPGDLEPHLAECGLDGCVAVQARTDERENECLLAFARAHPWILGVVGWMDLSSPAVPDRLDAALANPRMVGFREILQGEPDERFLNPAFVRGLRLLGERGFTYDVLVYSHQLEAVGRLLRLASPDQRIVLDHVGKPGVRDGEFEPWARRIRTLAADHPNLSCKLSGLVTEAGLGWSADRLIPYMDTVLDAFGPGRIMYGSDWPVCLVTARTYAVVHGLVATWARPLGEDASSALFGANAERFYKLAGHRPESTESNLP